MDDFRVAIRKYVNQPGFALTVIVTLAITVGATATVVSVVHTVLARALPYAAPERLVWVASVRPDNPSAPFTLPEFMDYRSQTRTLSGLAAYATWSASLAGDGVAERLQGARISANAFDVLGVVPVAGRLLSENDDRPDAAPVVVISYRLWQRRFDGAADVVGKTARINGDSFTIVGVLPAQFILPLRDLDVVTALVPDRDPLRHVRGSVNFLRLFGRLSDGTDAQQAQSELTTICRTLRQQFPVEYARKEAVTIASLHEVLVADYRQSMLILFAAVIVVHAAALANLVSLALVRANGRRAELSMRVALGASRLRLTRQISVEALLLAVAGCGLGWIVASQAIVVATAWAPPSVPRLSEVTLDGSVTLFVIGITLVVTLLLTIAPLGVVSAVSKTSASETLRPASHGAIGDRWNHRIRNAMVVAEISAALVLLLATTVLIQNLRRLQDLDPGFRPQGVFQARVSIPTAYRSTEDLARFYEQVAGRLASSPGVKSWGVISIAPLAGLLATVPFSVAAQPDAEGARPSANLREISPGYLDTVSTRLLQGRAFAETDRQNTPPVALVSAALADRFLAGHALGRQLLIDDNNRGPRPVEIVGIVENVRQAALDLPPALDIYLPLRQVHPDGVSLVRNNQFWMVRTDADPAAFRATFLAHLKSVDPDAAVSGTGAMRQFIDDWLGPRRFNLGLFGAFAVTTVLLAVLGLYGLVSYTVSQRAPEIGLRMAIGATHADVQRMILGQAGVLAAVGVIVGIAAAIAGRAYIARFVSDVRISPAAAAITAVVLVAVVLTAAWVPARRAARIEPTRALRGQ